MPGTTELERTLRLEPGQSLVALHPPSGFQAMDAPPAGAAGEVVLLFATSRLELQERAPAALAALKPEGTLWVAYPRPGDGAAADLSRDHGWGPLHAAGMTSSDLVRLDRTWNALRWRAGGAVPSADSLPVGRRATPAYRALRLCLVPLLRLAFRFRVSGREHIPREGAYVVIANHLGWLDALALLIVLPVEPRLHFIADVTGMMRRRWEWALVRAAGGIVPVDRARRGDVRLFRHVARCLEAGGAVALFPEGDMGPAEGALLPFKRGFAHFAAGAGVPIVPVGLAGPREVWLGKRIEVSIGPPIESAGRTVDQLAAAGEAAVRRAIPPYAEPGGPRILRRWLTGLF